jgi:hypothetical protein
MTLFRKKRPDDANTLPLIREWSMDGARGNLDGSFGSTLDLQALVAARDAEPRDETPAPAQAPLMMKPAGEDGWRPLLTDVSNAA